jgi:hypothetical protein
MAGGGNDEELAVDMEELMQPTEDGR